MRKARSIQELTIERLAEMSRRHYHYNPTPFYEMTERQARGFAMRQAVTASASIPMTMDEMKLYAGAVYESIRYFNERDPRHADHMRFIKECEERQKEARRRQLEVIRESRHIGLEIL